MAMFWECQIRHVLMFAVCFVVRLMRPLSLRNAVYVPCKESLASLSARMLPLR